jgi:hypothetical protein
MPLASGEPQHLLEHDAPGDQDLGARRVDDRQRLALRRAGMRSSRRVRPASASELEHVAVQLRQLAPGCSKCANARERVDRAGRSVDHSGPGLRSSRARGAAASDATGAGRPASSRGRVVLEQRLGEPQRAERHAHGAQQLAAADVHELRAAAADVHDERGALGEVERRTGPRGG